MKNCLTKRCSQMVWALILLVASPWISAGAEPAAFAKPEKSRLEVGTAGSGTTSLPLFVALEGGYFAKRGLSVSVNQVGATVAVRGLFRGPSISTRVAPRPSLRTWRAQISSTLPRPWIGTR